MPVVMDAIPDTNWCSLREDGEHIVILDQTRLPDTAATIRLTTLTEVEHAITSMQVRGAPLIGITAAYGIALGLHDDASDDCLHHVMARLAATRPTAINLAWALERMHHHLHPLPVNQRYQAAWSEAKRMADEDIRTNAAIAGHGLKLLQSILNPVKTLNLMTHCNAGRLATVAHGTALAPVYAAHKAGINIHVWVSETRPRNQGLLTAWELSDAGVPHTMITDSTAGWLMMQGKVDCVMVGADRIAANGDTVNKVGTYLKALAARAHDVPFYVAAPKSTIDFTCINSMNIPIEERHAKELAATATVPVINPAFDITPAALVDSIITEHGISRPQELAKLQSKTAA